jgi:GT2 family glycosyltransferase
MMSDKGSVSVHIVTFNSEADIRDCLNSLTQQNYPLKKVVIVDNNSQDNTSCYVSEFGDTLPLTLICNDRNLGFAKGHNQALHLSKSDYVLVLNPDVVLDPDYISNLVQSIYTHPTTGSIIGKLMHKEDGTIDSTGLLPKKNRRFEERGALEQDKFQYDYDTDIFGVSAAAALYRREMVKDISLDGEFFDASFFAYKEDVDVAWRARLLGWGAKYVPNAIGYHKRGWGDRKSRKRIPLIIRQHSYINRYAIMIKNEGIGNMLLHIPYIIFYDILLLLYLLISEKEVLTVWTKFSKQLPILLKKRKWIQSRRKVPLREVYRYFK